MSPSDPQTLTSVDLYTSQTSLLHAAATALPHQFSTCTYPLGPLRQAVYLCLTCTPPPLPPRGICSACSIACHADHEQLELFPKRGFRCDCPTAGSGSGCALYGAGAREEANAGNVYGQNFRGVFCRCGRGYDAARERETMVQCVACEDWFHESCLNLRERPPSREPSPEEEGDEEDEEDDLPPPLISGDDYDALVCGSCVLQIPTLRRWAGTRGAMMVVRDAEGDAWRVIGADGEVDVKVEVGEKRSRDDDDDASEGSSKRLRASPSTSAPARSDPCLAPPINPTAQKIYHVLAKSAPSPDKTNTPEPDLGAGDVFLTEDWRTRWCKCPSCLPSLESRPYLLEEEETYEPPEDPDSGLSLEELGMRALSRLPRERALDGIRAFNAMRDGLMDYLRPFAAEGRVVEEADVKAFFEARTAEAGQGAPGQ